MNKENILLVVPVKGNSKRVPQKNLRELNGKPLFIYACNAVCEWERVLDCACYISSENKEVKKIYNKSHIKYIFSFIDRPKELSEDPNQIEEVCLHVIDTLKKKYTTLIMVQPSNPFVLAEDIENCYKMFIENDRSTIRSVYKTTKSFFQSFCMIGDKLVSPAFSQLSKTKTCNYPDSYLGNGSIIIIDTEKFKQDKTFLSEVSLGYVMPRERSIDIDTELDFFIAEQLMRKGG